MLIVGKTVILDSNRTGMIFIMPVLILTDDNDNSGYVIH